MTKDQKLLIISHIIYLICVFLIIDNYDEDYDDYLPFYSANANFVLFISPLLTYWAGVWVSGFGWLKSLCQKYFSRQKNNKKPRQQITHAPRNSKFNIYDYLFDGKLLRADFLSRMISIYFIAIMANVVFFKYINGWLLVFSVLSVYIISRIAELSIVIRRANDFTETPWFFGAICLWADIYSLIAQILTFAHVKQNIIDEYIWYSYVPWSIALLVLIFTPSEAQSENNE